MRFLLHIDRRVQLSYLYLFKWIILSIGAGIVGTLTVRSFAFMADSITVLLRGSSLPPPLWATGGALLVGAFVYRVDPGAAGEGMPTFLRAIRQREGRMSLLTAGSKYLAALITLSTFGNGGIVGPLGSVAAGIMSAVEQAFIALRLGFTDEDRRTAAVCGMAAVVGTVFHSAIGGGIFAVEIIQRTKMEYRDLFSSVFASTTAVIISRTFGWGGYYRIHTSRAYMDTRWLPWLLLLALASGLAGGLYTYLYRSIAHLVRRERGNVLLKVVAGSLVSALVAWSINPELLGTSTHMLFSIRGRRRYSVYRQQCLNRIVPGIFHSAMDSLSPCPPCRP